MSEDSESPMVGELVDIGEIEERSGNVADSELSVSHYDLTQGGLSSALVREDPKEKIDDSPSPVRDYESNVEVHQETGFAKVRKTVRRWTGRAVSWLKRFVGF